MKKQLLKITTAVLTILALFSACKKKDVVETDPNAKLIKYLVGAEISAGEDSESYLIPTNNLMEGKISALNNGIEGLWRGVTKDGYFYAENSAESSIDRYKITETGLEKIDAISIPAIIPPGYVNTIDIIAETNEILLGTSPYQNDISYYAILDLATFTVKSSGTFQVPTIENHKIGSTRVVVANNKAYVGTDYDTETIGVPNKLITVVYDYPSFTNPKIITNPNFKGSVAGFRTNATLKDEKGDLYQHTFKSKMWNWIPEDAKSPIVFVRIKNGEYDDYVFDISAQFNEPISIWNVWYAENGIAFAHIVKENDFDVSESFFHEANLYGNIGKIYKVDLYNKALTELNIPKAVFHEIWNLNAVKDGNFFLPVSILNGKANIYEIAINGGANDVKVGAELDGANVQINSLNRS